MIQRPLLGLLLVLALAAGVRVVSYREIADGPLPELHLWGNSDMSFYDAWAQSVAGGDWLTRARMRPSHLGHAAVAREAHRLSGSTEPFDDAVATRVWDGWLGERTFYQDPLYPYFLALIYGLFGRSPAVVVLVQGALGLGIVAMVFGLGRWLFDDRTALLAGILAALFGPLIFYEAILLRPVLTSFTGMATLCLFVRAIDRPGRHRGFLLAGLMAGAAFLVQTTALLFFAATLAVLVRRPSLRGGLAPAVLGFAVAVSPLAMRNLAVGIQPFSIAATGTWTFINHNAEDYDPAAGDAISRHAPSILVHTGGRLVPAVIETLRTHPGPASWLRQLGQKLLAFWHWYEMPNNTNFYYYQGQAPATAAVSVPFSWVAGPAAMGLVLALGRSLACRLAALYLASGVASILVFYSLSRFRLPIAMGMLPFAAYGAVSLLRLVHDRRYGRLALCLLAVTSLTLLVCRPLPPESPRIRPADYQVPNYIAGYLARRQATEGHLVRALRLVERQLAMMPADLQAAEAQAGGTEISRGSSEAARSFAELHAFAASLGTWLGRAEEEVQEHHRRARVLNAVASRFEAGLPSR